MQRRIVFSALAAAALTVACSSIDTVAVEVASQGSWPAERKPGSYAIERLPSQQANVAEQERVEAAALQALEGAGFTRVPEGQTADVLVQLGARLFELQRRDPFYGGPFGWRNDWWFYGARRPFFYGSSFGTSFPYDYPDYQREAAVLIRDRRSQQIVYETRAVYRSRWTSDTLLPALFDAAMKDFPRPALSPRTVTVALPKG